MLLLVEDDPMLGRTIVEGLSPHFRVEWVRSLGDARLALEASPYDVLLLDLSLPDGSGLDLLRELRGAGNTIAIIILTSAAAPAQRVEGLRLGADDYVGKPFDLDELIARCEAAARRALGQPAPVLTLGDLVYDRGGHALTRDGVPVPLSSTDLRLFDLLVARAGRIVSKSQIEERLYAWSGEVESNTVEVYISRLRRKVGHDRIRTVRGLGYMLEMK